METIPCPGCRTELGPEVTACPICTRPRSKYEITRAYAALRAEKERRRKRPFLFAAYALVLGGLGALGYRFRAPLQGLAGRAHARLTRFADQAMDPSRLSSHPDAAAVPAEAAKIPPAPPAPSAAPVSRPPAAVSGPAIAPAAQKGAFAPKLMRAPEGDIALPAMDTSTQWALRGRVYDLLTLRPIQNASLSVRANNGMMGGFISDAYGRYLVVLPRLNDGGYDLVCSNPGYAPAVFYESDIPYARLSAADRRDMAESAVTGDLHHTPLTDITGEDSIHRDIFLVPRR